MEGYSFSTDVRVRFADTDAQGVAHNASYLVWFEVARVEYLRAYAGGYQALRDLGIEAFVLESFCRYIVPARFDDVLRVHARCVGLRGARFRYEYSIVRDDGTLMAEGWTAHACVVPVSVVVVPGFFFSALGPIRTSLGSARYDEYQTSWYSSLPLRS